MKLNFLNSGILFISSCMLFFLPFGCVKSQAESTSINESNSIPFHYSFQLNFNEYTVLNSALVSGLTKYNTQVEYSVKMANVENDIAWYYSITDENTMKELMYFIGQKAREWEDEFKKDPTNNNKKTALHHLQLLMEKVAHSHFNPIWEIETVVGTLVKGKNGWLIQDSSMMYEIIGNKFKLSENMVGKIVIGQGYQNTENQFELVHFIEKKENTLELFVMSQCPIAIQVENVLFDFIEKLPEDTKPNIEIRYIFYPTDINGSPGFSTLHGEPELKENLVQMLIRDRYPEIFIKYLQKRIEDASAPWESLVKEFNIGDTAIQSLSESLIKDRETLIKKEYEYVRGIHQIDDGSPTFVWESQKVRDITTMKKFEKINFSAPPDASCSN